MTVPRELIPAASLSFAGLRSYRRDGFGAELVAVLEDDPVASSASRGEAPTPRAKDGTAARGARWHRDRTRDFSEMPSPSLTLLLRFPGDDLEDVLTTRDVLISAHDPTRTPSSPCTASRCRWRPTTPRATACGWRARTSPGNRCASLLACGAASTARTCT